MQNMCIYIMLTHAINVINKTNNATCLSGLKPHELAIVVWMVSKVYYVKLGLWKILDYLKAPKIQAHDSNFMWESLRENQRHLRNNQNAKPTRSNPKRDHVLT